MLLTIDIGGTNTRCAVFKNSIHNQYFHHKIYESQRYSSLESIISDYLKTAGETINCAVIGVPGPIENGVAKTTNLSWTVAATALKSHFPFDSVVLLNDLEALGHAVSVLEEQDLVTINSGRINPSGNIALAAPGTGLGEAFLSRCNGVHRVFASEGGHADYAPTNHIEIRLLSFLMKRFDHVSYERICSGPGIFNIYNFLKHSEKFSEPGWLAEKIRSADDPTPIIMQYAENPDHSEPVCRRTFDIFSSALASECGNLALKFNASGGVYIGGGIAPKLLSFLTTDRFLKSFFNKGRFSDVMSGIPLKVILKPDAALFGLASFASSSRPDKRD